jgi:hypothetical protein
VLGGKIVEGEQRIAVLHEARDRLVVLDPVGLDKSIEGDQRLRFGLGHPDVLERAFGLGLQARWQLVQDVGGLMHDPNAIDAVRFTTSMPFAGAEPTLRRRRSDARFP